MAGPAAVAEARSFVRAAIESWDVPADSYLAALLTSELMTNAIKHERGESVQLFVTCYSGCLRVYVQDTSCAWPTLLEVPVDAEAGRGLMLVESLSTEWGCYRTPAGKVVYFTLALGTCQDEAGTTAVVPGHPLIGWREDDLARQPPASVASPHAP